MSAGISLFLMADHIFHSRRGLPALIVKAPKATVGGRTFELPEPLDSNVLHPHSGPGEESDRS